jgi:peroxiredoxin
MRQLPAGVQAPDFELKDIKGVGHHLHIALTEGSVVLVFFKVSCPTCEFTFPHIQRIFASAGKDWHARLWGISQDDAEDTRRFAQRHGITFDMVIDEYPYEVSNAYRIVSVPTMFIIEQDGKIRMSDNGFSKASLNQIAGHEVFRPNDGLPAARPG